MLHVLPDVLHPVAEVLLKNGIYAFPHLYDKNRFESGAAAAAAPLSNNLVI
jgi:hypothetical protein